MEELQAKHRKEAKELQARITQKKKGASKKTRKGVNDECDVLEREMKDRQAQEMADLEPTRTSTTQADMTADEMADLTLNRTADTNGPSSTAQASAPSIPPPNPQDPSQSQTAADQDTAAAAADQITTKRPNRAKARLARRQAEQTALFARAASEASTLPNEKKIERNRMLLEFSARDLTETEIRADGHCLYSAVADQMTALGVPLGTGTPAAAAAAAKPRISLGPLFGKREDERAGEEPYRVVRRAAAGYIESHPDDFEAFLEEPLGEYVRKIRETGEWGGQLELMALAKTYGVRISVLQGDGRVEEIMGDGNDGEEEKRIWLAYYRHGFGLGEHYNSLHKKN